LSKEKEEKPALRPIPTLESQPLEKPRSCKIKLTLLRNNRRWGGLGEGEEEEGGSTEFKGQNKCQPNTSIV
jgi:hypothetical protein